MLILYDSKKNKIPLHSNETQITCNKCNSVFRVYDHELCRLKYRDYPNADVYISICPVCKEKIIVK